MNPICGNCVKFEAFNEVWFSTISTDSLYDILSPLILDGTHRYQRGTNEFYIRNNKTYKNLRNEIQGKMNIIRIYMTFNKLISFMQLVKLHRSPQYESQWQNLQQEKE